MVNKTEVISDIQKFASSETTISEFCNSVSYSRGVVVYRFDSWVNAKKEAGIDVRCVKCPNCSNYYSYISNHWNTCGEPGLSEYQKSLLIGMLLSDGTVNKSGGFTSYSSNKQFLEWLSNELGFMAYPVVFNDSGDDRHERNIKSGFDSNRDAEYKDMYAVSTPVHTFTENLRSWYDGGNKSIPEDLPANTDIIKLWYCGDGGIHWNGNNAYAEIRAIGFDNENVNNIIEKLGFDYNIQKDGTVCFYGDTEKFLQKIGPAPKGMEYKWEIYDRDRYDLLKP